MEEEKKINKFLVVAIPNDNILSTVPRTSLVMKCDYPASIMLGDVDQDSMVESAMETYTKHSIDVSQYEVLKPIVLN